MKRESAAVIDEARCIGCTLCIEACPVDAIIGAPRYLHAVVEDWCVGCALCLPPCPVDCITMRPLPTDKQVWRAQDARAAGQRARARQARRARIPAPAPKSPAERRAVLSAAIASAHSRKSARHQ